MTVAPQSRHASTNSAGLRVAQDPNRLLRGQRSIPGGDPLGLQFGHCFPTHLSARVVAELNAAETALQALPVARRSDASTKSPNAEAEGLSGDRAPIQRHPRQNRQDHAIAGLKKSVFTPDLSHNRTICRTGPSDPPNNEQISCQRMASNRVFVERIAYCCSLAYRAEFREAKGSKVPRGVASRVGPAADEGAGLGQASHRRFASPIHPPPVAAADNGRLASARAAGTRLHEAPRMLLGCGLCPSEAAALPMGPWRGGMLLTVRVIAAEVFPHLAHVSLAPCVDPPWRQRNCPQDPQNPAHRL